MTSRLPIVGMTNCSRKALGFGFGSDTESVAAEWANGRFVWRGLTAGTYRRFRVKQLEFASAHTRSSGIPGTARIPGRMPVQVTLAPHLVMRGNLDFFPPRQTLESSPQRAARLQGASTELVDYFG